uniref:Uncharacterized protein n=1 Tax=Gossypium raimondii TaxID=29730 RepID=A0A0D2T1Q7_GOSRA|nr:hypothetical protein B456_008G167800 [Gossypium raimondii]
MRESPCPPQQLEHTKSSIKKTLDSWQHVGKRKDTHSQAKTQSTSKRKKYHALKKNQRSKTATTRSLNLRSHSPKVSSQKNLCRLW